MRPEDPAIHLTHEALAERIAGVKATVDKAFNVGLVLFSLCAGAAFGVWRELGAHGEKLENLTQARLVERMATIESSRFTANDGARLTADVNALGVAIRADLAAVRESMAAIRARPENGASK